MVAFGEHLFPKFGKTSLSASPPAACRETIVGAATLLNIAYTGSVETREQKPSTLLLLILPMDYLLFRLFGGSNRRFIPQIYGTGSSSDSRLPGREQKRLLMFVLMLSTGAVACLGTILALFAWTHASL
jgi:hypothetical protein